MKAFYYIFQFIAANFAFSMANGIYLNIVQFLELSGMMAACANFAYTEFKFNSLYFNMLHIAWGVASYRTIFNFCREDVN